MIISCSLLACNPPFNIPDVLSRTEEGGRKRGGREGKRDEGEQSETGYNNIPLSEWCTVNMFLTNVLISIHYWHHMSLTSNS